jgi:hypothetical protein
MDDPCSKGPASRPSSTADLVAPLSPAWATGIASKAEAGSRRDSVRSMSQQNVAVGRRWVELFNARDDVDEFLSLHDPEVVLQTPGGPRLRGHDQVRDMRTCGHASSRSLRLMPPPLKETGLEE